MNKKKVIIISIICVFLVFLAIISVCVFMNKKNEEEKERQKEFIESAIELNEDILISSAKLEDVGNEILSYWHDAIYEDTYDSIDTAVYEARNDNIDTLIEIVEEKEKIQKIYRKIIKFNIKETAENKKIKELIEQEYDIFLELESLISFPSGSYNDFSSKFNELDYDLAQTYNKLKLLLE